MDIMNKIQLDTDNTVWLTKRYCITAIPYRTYDSFYDMLKQIVYKILAKCSTNYMYFSDKAEVNNTYVRLATLKRVGKPISKNIANTMYGGRSYYYISKKQYNVGMVCNAALINMFSYIPQRIWMYVKKR